MVKQPGLWLAPDAFDLLCKSRMEKSRDLNTNSFLCWWFILIQIHFAFFFSSPLKHCDDVQGVFVQYVQVSAWIFLCVYCMVYTVVEQVMQTCTYKLKEVTVFVWLDEGVGRVRIYDDTDWERNTTLVVTYWLRHKVPHRKCFTLVPANGVQLKGLQNYCFSNKGSWS